MPQTENKTDFMTALKAAILESLLQKKVITAAEKAAFNQKKLS